MTTPNIENDIEETKRMLEQMAKSVGYFTTAVQVVAKEDGVEGVYVFLFSLANEQGVYIIQNVTRVLVTTTKDGEPPQYATKEIQNFPKKDFGQLSFLNELAKRFDMFSDNLFHLDIRAIQVLSSGMPLHIA